MLAAVTNTGQLFKHPEHHVKIALHCIAPDIERCAVRTERIQSLINLYVYGCRYQGGKTRYDFEGDAFPHGGR